MISLYWTRPSPTDQKACFDKAESFNYDGTYRGASARSLISLQEDKQISRNGFFLNHARLLLGSGLETYDKVKNALHSWRHYDRNWIVEPTTRVETGVKFCVCVKEMIPIWLMIPSQVVYVNEEKSGAHDHGKKVKASFSFAIGSLQGALLAGEERFSVELDDKDQVWYEVLSLSKPGNLLASIVYPYVKYRQKCFAKESANALLRHLSVV